MEKWHRRYDSERNEHKFISHLNIQTKLVQQIIRWANNYSQFLFNCDWRCKREKKLKLWIKSSDLPTSIVKFQIFETETILQMCTASFRQYLGYMFYIAKSRFFFCTIWHLSKVDYLLCWLNIKRQIVRLVRCKCKA